MISNKDYNFVVTNPDLIFHFPHSLPDDLLKSIYNFSYDQLKWSSADFQETEFQKTAGWYKYYDFIENNHESDLISRLKNISLDLFKSIDANIVNSITYHKGYMIMSDKGEHTCDHEIHQDTNTFGGIWSMLFHLVGTEGPTNFYDNFFDKRLVKSIDFVPGNLIIFPSIYPHKGNPKFRDRRITIDFISHVDCSLNEHILDKSISLKKKYQHLYQ